MVGHNLQGKHSGIRAELVQPIFDQGLNKQGHLPLSCLNIPKIRTILICLLLSIAN
jgi:hypothetical protein